MRAFNYSKIKEQKWDSEILGYIAAIYKEAGKQELYLKQRPEELEHLVVDKANLWLDPGFIFGAVGEGFERINIACPRQTLKQAMDQLRDALNAEAFLN